MMIFTNKRKASPSPLLTYHYECINKQGEKCQGEIRAGNVELAKKQLRQQGYYPLLLQKKIPSFFSFFKTPIKKNEITYFSRQLATLLTAGISLVPACDMIAKGTQNPILSHLIVDIKTTLEMGHSLSEALAQYPAYFDPLFCHLVTLGEASGSLDSLLESIANYREKIESLKRKIHKSLFYPGIVMIFAIVITAMLLLFIVPQFEHLFTEMGAALPFFTQIIIKLSTFIQNTWLVILFFLMSVSGLFFYCKNHYLGFQRLLDKMLLKSPILHPILTKVYVSRYAYTLAITFTAGIPLVDALRSVAGATGNWVYRDAILKIREQISLGSSIHCAMRETGLFPHLTIQMVAIGEESGTLDKMLRKIAMIFEEEIDVNVEALTALLEPFTMAFLGILVGSLVISMYLPIFNMGQGM